MKLFKRNITLAQTYGSGLALILIFLIIFFFKREILYIQIITGITILLMIWTTPFRYFGILWMAFGDGMGKIVSRIVLSAIFLLLVVPVGLVKGGHIRKTMQINLFGKGQASLFKNRDHVFSKNDFEKPF